MIKIEHDDVTALNLHILTDKCTNKKQLQAIAEAFSHEEDHRAPFTATMKIDQAKPFIVEQNNMCVGGGSFIERTYVEVRIWCFQWIWLHPSVRGKGLYKSLHRFFRAQFGSFRPEPPLSERMTGFLLKYDSELFEMSKREFTIGLCACCGQSVLTTDQHYKTSRSLIHVEKCKFPKSQYFDVLHFPDERTVITAKGGIKLTVRTAFKNDIIGLMRAQWNLGYALAHKWFISNFGADFPVICVALLDDQIIGRLHIDLNPNHRINKSVSDCGIIDNLFIERQYRGKGVADSLIEFAEDIIQSVGYRVAEIGINYAEPESLMQYIRHHFHDDPIYQKDTISFTYPHSTASFIQTHRYKDGLVFYKHFDKQCDPHNEKERDDIRREIMGLRPED